MCPAGIAAVQYSASRPVAVWYAYCI